MSDVFDLRSIGDAELLQAIDSLKPWSTFCIDYRQMRLLEDEARLQAARREGPPTDIAATSS